MLQVHGDPSSPQGMFFAGGQETAQESKCSPMTGPYGSDHPGLRNHHCRYHHSNKEVMLQTWALSAQAMCKHRAKKRDCS